MTSNDETNAATPQRIDLTQFEGNTEGPWIMDELGEIWRAVAPDAEPYCVMSFYHHPSIKPSEADLRLMAAGPALIAELKRTYDKIDVLEERLQFSEHIMETMHDEHYADLVMDFIAEAHPSKWCDWGHCRECQRRKNE